MWMTYHLVSRKKNKLFDCIKRQRIFYQWGRRGGGGIKLRKWNLNCECLQDFINNDSKETIDENCIKKILGLDLTITSFIFYFTDIINTASNLPITKKKCFTALVYVFRLIGTNISHRFTD